MMVRGNYMINLYNLVEDGDLDAAVDGLGADVRQVLDDPLGAEALEHLARERGAHREHLGAGGDAGLDSGGSVLDDDTWLLAHADLWDCRHCHIRHSEAMEGMMWNDGICGFCGFCVGTARLRYRGLLCLLRRRSSKIAQIEAQKHGDTSTCTQPGMWAAHAVRKDNPGDRVCHLTGEIDRDKVPAWIMQIGLSGAGV